jgi:hypothetical protein
VASTAIRDRRRVLRYRDLMVKQMMQMKNRVSGLLMETGVSYNKQRLHKVGYFGELMSTNAELSDAVRPRLNLIHDMIRRSEKLEYNLVNSLEREPLLGEMGSVPQAPRGSPSLRKEPRYPRHFPSRGVRNDNRQLMAWCPRHCGFGTTRLNRLTELSGLKKAKDSCIQ